MAEPEEKGVVIGKGDGRQRRATPALVIVDIRLCLLQFQGDAEGNRAEVAHIARGVTGGGVRVVGSDHELVHFDLLGEVQNQVRGDAIDDLILGIPWDGIKATALPFVVKLVSSLESSVESDELEDELGICFEVSDDGGGVMGDGFGINRSGDEKLIDFGDGGVDDDGHGLYLSLVLIFSGVTRK